MSYDDHTWCPKVQKFWNGIIYPCRDTRVFWPSSCDSFNLLFNSWSRPTCYLPFLSVFGSFSMDKVSCADLTIELSFFVLELNRYSRNQISPRCPTPSANGSHICESEENFSTGSGVTQSEFDWFSIVFSLWLSAEGDSWMKTLTFPEFSSVRLFHSLKLNKNHMASSQSFFVGIAWNWRKEASQGLTIITGDCVWAGWH